MIKRRVAAQPSVPANAPKAARIAYLLAQHHIELRSAKINTLGARAEDTFWISGEALDRPQEVDELRKALQIQLA
ncbi:MAG: hypothetical protein KKH12_03025 [Gammaproteobacteria bacterium]|nr:hypothetical protein [Gammaproteobacteria bacterium]MBU1480627.1 hypothetical protein [Gammaproteobacteria bacterium]